MHVGREQVPPKKAVSEMTTPSQDFMAITSEVSQPTAFSTPISRRSSMLRLVALSQAKMMKAVTAPAKITSSRPLRQSKTES